MLDCEIRLYMEGPDLTAQACIRLLTKRLALPVTGQVVPYYKACSTPECSGPATRCDAALPRWDIPIHLRCTKIACDGLLCIFQHVGNFAPDFGISQPLIVRFTIGLDYSDGHSIGFPVIYDSKLPIKYFLLPVCYSRWKVFIFSCNDYCCNGT